LSATVPTVVNRIRPKFPQKYVTAQFWKENETRTWIEYRSESMKELGKYLMGGVDVSKKMFCEGDCLCKIQTGPIGDRGGKTMATPCARKEIYDSVGQWQRTLITNVSNHVRSFFLLG
jgi:hypothetical protein